MRGLRFLAPYLLAWAPFAALYALVLAATQGLPAAAAAEAALWSVLPGALLGLGVWRAADRLTTSGRGRLVAAHAALAVAYAALWSAAVVGQIAAFAPPETLNRYLERALGWDLVMGAVVYAAIVGTRTALAATRRARASEAAAARAEALRARAELQALRARLDPHFLFNTLHSVTALVRSDAAAAERALERFAELMRYVLDAERAGRDGRDGRDGQDDVALAEELAFVRAYVGLERLRLGDRLRVVESVDPETLDCAIPALTLQPLVENAVRHGIAPLARGGTLRLSAQLDGDALVLEVGDDGAGARAPGEGPPAPARPSGIGLTTVRQRLRARFPGAASTEVVTSPGEGFVVRARVPAVPHAPRAAPVRQPAPARGAADTPAGAARG